MNFTRRKLSAAAILFAATIAVLFAAGPAAASTFCVPAYFAGCPNNGTNIKQANLETAMSTSSSDGHPDTVMIDKFDYVDPDTLSPLGSDHLNIIGSGTDKTTLSSSDTGNQFVVNLSANHRPTDMSNLTIVIPASFPDSNGNGSALQAEDGTFDHVDIKSLNPDSDGANSLLGNTVWKNSRIYAAAGGSLHFAMEPNDSKSGKLEIINTTIEDSVWGLDISNSGVPVVMKRSRIISPVGYGVFVTDGGLFVMENSIIEGAGLEAVSVSTKFDMGSFPDIDVSIRASTLIAEPAADHAAIKLEITNGLNADIDVSDSIIYGYENTWEMDTPAGPGIGKGHLDLAHSDFKPIGLPEDAPNVDFTGAGNIDRDPKFKGPGDYSLIKGSPVIDAGGPENGGILEDYAGNVRPQDGDGDGKFVRDMGAFEAPTIATCKNTPSLCPVPPDKVKPKVSKVKFKAPKGKKKGVLRLKLSEIAKVTASFKPTPKGKGVKLRKAVKLKKPGKKGANKFKLKKGKLKPGKYKLTIEATDAAGNKSKPVVRRVKVKKLK